MANYVWKNRHGTYYFRVRIPPQYRYHFGHISELRRSLGTIDRATAKRRARALMAAVDRLIEDINDMTIKKEPDTFSTAYEVTITEEREPSGAFKLSKKLDMSPEEHQQLGDDAVRAIVEGLSGTTANPTPTPTKYCPKLSDVLEEFIASKKWDNPSTELKYRATVSILIGLIGDKPFNLVDKADARNFRKSLELLPGNMNHPSSPYKSMSIPEIIKSNPESTISPTTIRNHIINVKALFNWITGHYDEINISPFAGVEAPSVDPSAGRDAITNSDIAKIFSCYLYNSNPWPRSKRGKEPSKFWVPLIAAFTGCRLNEVCQLYLDDIKKIENIWVIDFNDSRDDQQLKGSFSRKVPMHEALTNAGLPEYVQQQRNAGHVRLFPELTYTDNGNGYGRTTSEFCSALFKSLGASGTLHGFRHSVMETLIQADVELRKAQYIVGHKGDQSVAEAVYGANKFTVDQLQVAINKLNYGFDFHSITFTKFKFRTRNQLPS